jgi:hypothetical protein
MKLIENMTLPGLEADENYEFAALIQRKRA